MSLQRCNFKLFIGFYDVRPVEELVRHLNEMLGGEFVQDQEYKSRGMVCYCNYLLGLNVDLLQIGKTAEGFSYRLIGSNHPGYRFDTAEEEDLSFHVLPLLEAAGCQQVRIAKSYKDD